MKVSVIVPIFNADKYLGACLKSLKEQKLDGMEFILIDNCSEDLSREIISRFASEDDRFIPVFNDHNIGQAGSMNKALSLAKGEYVAECDADDFVSPAMYERLYNQAHLRDADIVQCGFFDLTKDGVTPRQVIERAYCGDPLSDFESRDLMGFLGWQPHIQSAIYRKSFLVDNGILYREGKHFDDTSLTFKLRTTGYPYCIIPDCLYYYRRDNLASGTYTEHHPMAVLEQYQEIERWNADRHLDLDIFISAMKYYTYKWNIGRLNGDERETFYKAAREDFQKDIVYSSLFHTEEDYKAYSEWRNG